MTYEDALQICRKNLKGSHDKEIMLTAHALEYLSLNPKTTPLEELGKLVGVSGEMVRQFLGFLKLPQPIQQMLEQKRLGIDQAHQLRRLRDRPEEWQVAVAEEMTKITSERARLFVSELVGDSKLTLDEAMKRAEAKEAESDRPKRIVVMLPHGRHRDLKLLAQRRNQTVEGLAADILGQWLDSADRKP